MWRGGELVVGVDDGAVRVIHDITLAEKRLLVLIALEQRAELNVVPHEASVLARSYAGK